MEATHPAQRTPPKKQLQDIPKQGQHFSRLKGPPVLRKMKENSLNPRTSSGTTNQTPTGKETHFHSSPSQGCLSLVSSAVQVGTGESPVHTQHTCAHVQVHTHKHTCAHPQHTRVHMQHTSTHSQHECTHSTCMYTHECTGTQSTHMHIHSTHACTHMSAHTHKHACEHVAYTCTPAFHMCTHAHRHMHTRYTHAHSQHICVHIHSTHTYT